MKKTAILIYNQFCNFEIAPVLEMLAMAQKPITVFAKSLNPIRSEEGLKVLPEKNIYELELEEYDSLILPGAILNNLFCPISRVFVRYFIGMTR